MHSTITPLRSEAWTTLTRLLALALCLATVVTDARAAPHTLTYVEKSVPIGTRLGSWELIRMPIRLFSGEKFALIVPRRPGAVGYTSVFSVTTQHLTDDFEPNITIDSYPAQVIVQDVRTYEVSGDIGTASWFVVAPAVRAVVLIAVGTTQVEVHFQVSDTESSYDMGPGFSALRYAEWDKYRDRTDHIALLDDLIDYIRVNPL